MSEITKSIKVQVLDETHCNLFCKFLRGVGCGFRCVLYEIGLAHDDTHVFRTGNCITK